MKLFQDIKNPKLTDKEIEEAFWRLERRHLKQLFNKLNQEEAELHEYERYMEYQQNILENQSPEC